MQAVYIPLLNHEWCTCTTVYTQQICMESALHVVESDWKYRSNAEPYEYSNAGIDDSKSKESPRTANRVTA